MPSTLDKRFTRFGYGKKVDFTAGRRYDIGKSATLTDKTREEILEKIKNEVILKEPEGIKEKKKYYFSLMGSNFPSKFRSNEGITICERHKPKDLRDLRNIFGKNYDVEEFYRNHYKDELTDGRFDMANPSSKLTSSAFK